MFINKEDKMELDLTKIKKITEETVSQSNKKIQEKIRAKREREINKKIKQAASKGNSFVSIRFSYDNNENIVMSQIAEELKAKGFKVYFECDEESDCDYLTSHEDSRYLSISWSK